MEFARRVSARFETKRLPEDVDDGLETLEEYKQRWRSVRIIYFTMFLMALGFSIILTGIWPYLNKLDPDAGKEFMGLIVAANPLGQMIFSPIFGWWGNKLGKIRLPLLLSLSLFTLASGIYSSLELRPDNVKYWMLSSRFLIGVSSANIALCRSYLSAATRISERTHAVAMVSLAQVLGFIIGPTLQAAVTPLGDQGHVWLWGKMHFNMYTASGWINVLMSIGNFMMFLPGVFEEHKIAAREVMVMQGGTSEKETWKGIKPSYLSAWTLIVAFFVLVFNFVLLETLGTSLTMDMFAWSNDEALWYMGIMMTIAAIVSLVTFVLIEPMCKIIAERYVLIWGGFSLMFLGRVLFRSHLLGLPHNAEMVRRTAGLDPDAVHHWICLHLDRISHWGDSHSDHILQSSGTSAAGRLDGLDDRFGLSVPRPWSSLRGIHLHAPGHVLDLRRYFGHDAGLHVLVTVQQSITNPANIREGNTCRAARTEQAQW
ncbi:major facilitator superfamily domain-containing protein 8 isoform X2 [Drosophila simulans]|uniref:major facilitator superfamily domain-containing protein 8 isoform X2 n=1 Tax=Drosophila simulans TaxID=7240 RepID=UPI001D10A3AC|nr:major facilitator superfamily domain-containing protein 8 isoform X2 [Drosophila simulans]